jgi:MFS transporter, DHA1 family, multidrug resistance protein
LAGLGLGQLIIGQLPDAVGRRRPLLLGLGWHAVMSVLCALAPTITVPAATCTLQGVSRVPPCGAMATMREMFSGTRRAAVVPLVSGSENCPDPAEIRPWPHRAGPG